MSLSKHVRISRRFQRAIRIDEDLGNPKSLEGFVCPQSSIETVLTMAQHVSESRQGAFTWTGPYGSGKSSLVVALSALLNGSASQRECAEKMIGKRNAQKIWGRLPPKTRGWQSLGVVGKRADPVQVIGKSLNASGLLTVKKRHWTDSGLIKSLLDIAKSNPRSHGGLIIYIDELGKFLEAAVQGSSDVYFFQQLAESASRSNGRLIIIGILHQAFDEYANRLSREAREEWAKIQGRFIDLPVNVVGEEQIDLLARAIKTRRKPERQSELANLIGNHMRERRSGTSSKISQMLANCWPLHPITATLLGPISCRRFGQNQRSIFGFLNSAEPEGFQDFVKHADETMLYEPARLWDYLRTNMEAAILASPDGHRWATAAEAIDRCDATGEDEFCIRILKSIALLDLFKDRSGVLPSLEVLQACVPEKSTRSVKKALEQLGSQSLILFKKFLGAYSIHAGSDFDIEQATKDELNGQFETDFSTLRALVSLQPILAKRHYHKYGTFRWFDVDIAPLKNLADKVASFNDDPCTIGQFLLAIPTSNEDFESAKVLCRNAAKCSKYRKVVVGLSKHSWAITSLTRELSALGRVQNGSIELQGDPVARREVQARLAELQAQLETNLQKAFNRASWYRKGRKTRQYMPQEINNLVSRLADEQYPCTLPLQNELLNRARPSASAISARNLLLKHMINNLGEKRLGIHGYPAESGLFVTILERTGLYAKTKQGWRFTIPKRKNEHQERFATLWETTSKYLREHNKRSIGVNEIYALWQTSPYGLKAGIMPVLMVAYILSNQSKIAFYSKGVFQSRFKELDAEILAQDPKEVQLRWMDSNKISQQLLFCLAEIIHEIAPSNTLENLMPINVGRGLIAIFDSLHPWVKRTSRLSKTAIQIRVLFKKASDPNALLFNDLPALAGIEPRCTTDQDIASVETYVRGGLEELVNAYPTMLKRIGDDMLAKLQVPNASPSDLADLQMRATNIQEISGDFRLNAFITRIATFKNTRGDIEGLASLATSKPLHDWVDADLDRASIVVADFAQKFNRLEAFAHVKGRQDKRHAMAIILGMKDKATPLMEEFDITDAERQDVDKIVESITCVLESTNQNKKNVIMAALAELSARHMRFQMISDGEEHLPSGKIS